MAPLGSVSSVEQPEQRAQALKTYECEMKAQPLSASQRASHCAFVDPKIPFEGHRAFAAVCLRVGEDEWHADYEIVGPRDGRIRDADSSRDRVGAFAVSLRRARRPLRYSTSMAPEREDAKWRVYAGQAAWPPIMDTYLKHPGNLRQC